jgi:trimeric autotransporter adhesin
MTALSRVLCTPQYFTALAYLNSAFLHLSKINLMKKIFTLIFTVGMAMSLFGQVTTNGGSGMSATYTDLASAIADLNTKTITAPVTITLLTGNLQTAPAGGYVITATGTAANTITLLGAGAGSTVSASAAQVSGRLDDAIFKIIGGDYITIDGFKMQENATNATATVATNNMTEWVSLCFMRRQQMVRKTTPSKTTPFH